MPESPVRELRLALTVERYDEAIAFYRDVLGLPVTEVLGRARRQRRGARRGTGNPGAARRPGGAGRPGRGRVPGRRPGPGRARGRRLGRDGPPARRRRREALADPVVTPWSHRNVRVRAPDGMQLTLFTVLDDAAGQAPSR